MNETGKRSAPERQIRVAAYCRVANDFDATFSGIEAQKAYLMNEIAAHPEWTMTAVYADESAGRSLNRMAFEKMIMACRQGEIDVILTSSIFQFARDMQDLIRTAHELKRLDIAVIFARERINTLETDIEPLLTMMGACAQTRSKTMDNLCAYRYRLSGIQSQNRQSKKISHWGASR